MNTKNMLSLEEFADMVLAGDAWKAEMPGIMQRLPSPDVAIREMASMPKEKRDHLREKLAHMQGEIGSYIGELGDAMRTQRGIVNRAKQGSHASAAYGRSKKLANE
jgi:hypothetical protein